MRRVCKDTYDIDGIIIGERGDVLKIVDAVPSDGESYEDVDGYCDIINETSGKTFNATWIDIYENLLTPLE